MIDQPATSGRFDVVIAGAGPTGLAMALALTHMLEDDVSVALVDRGPAPAQPAAQAAPADPRAWALSNASKRFLEALGIWREVVPEAQPVTEIDITDSSLEAGVRPVLLHYENTTEEGEPAAWIVPNGVFTATSPPRAPVSTHTRPRSRDSSRGVPTFSRDCASIRTWTSSG